MNKKIIYLFLALLLPGLIFIFLKFFGKNEFDIPVYYNDGVAESPSECHYTKTGQYYVSDSVLAKWKWSGLPILVSSTFGKEKQELDQLLSESNIDGIQQVDLSTNEILIKRCVLFLKDPWNVVLIDKQKRIRGYYKIGHRDDMDRLEVELKILLKKY